MRNIDRNRQSKSPEHMRQKAMSIAMKRKEEYLGARVPRALKERVMKRAEEMDIPVSLLIRKVLEETFSEGNSPAINALVDKSASKSKINTEKTDKYADIVGWKTVEVNQDRSCERCKEPLPRGSEGALGFTASDSSYVIVCHQCKSDIINT